MEEFKDGYKKILEELLSRQSEANMPYYDEEYQSQLKALCVKAYEEGLNVQDVTQLINEIQYESVDISMMALSESIPEQLYFEYYTKKLNPNNMNKIGTGYIVAAWETDTYYDENGEIENEYNNFNDGVGAVLEPSDISRLKNAQLVIANSKNEKNHETEFGEGYEEEVPVYGEGAVGDTLFYISTNYPQYGSEFAIYTTEEDAKSRAKILDEAYSACFGDDKVYSYVEIKECNMREICDRANQITARKENKRSKGLTYQIGKTDAFKKAMQAMAKQSSDKPSDLKQITGRLEDREQENDIQITK